MSLAECRHCGAIALHKLQQICFECGEPYRQPWFNTEDGIKSLRKNPFTELTAFCEVIDNSIEAQAENIKIKMEHNGTEIVYMGFGDDGIGMNFDVGKI